MLKSVDVKMYDLKRYLRYFPSLNIVAVLCVGFLFGCTEEDINTTSTQPTPPPASQPINDINDASGLWDISKEILVQAFFEQGAISARTDGMSGSTWIDVDSDGNVSLIIQSLSIDNTTTELIPCYFIQKNFEKWQRVEENTFIAIGTRTREIKLRRTQDSLVVEGEKRVEVFQSADPSAFDFSQSCEINGTPLALAPESDRGNEVFSLTDITGTWESPFFVNLFENFEDFVEMELIQVFEDGDTFSWRKIQGETCLLPVWRVENIRIRESDGRFTFRQGDVVTRDTQLFEVFSNTFNTPSMIRNLLAVDPEGFRATEMFTESTIDLSDRESRCDLLRADLAELDARPIVSLADVSGIWKLRPLNALDEGYLRLRPDGEFTVYNFLETVSGSGEGCYKEEQGTVLEEIGSGIFTLQSTLFENTSIEIFLTAAQTLVLLSEQDSEGVYNRELVSTAPGAVNDLLPLCPSVRE